MAQSIPLGQLYPRGGLAVDCWEAAPRFTALLPHHFRDPLAFARQAEKLESRAMDRESLRDVLAGQNAAFSAAPEAMRQLERLADPRAVAVIGGQQAGLFSGPLYTIHKAATIVRLATEMEARLARPVVPVFWIASEDSDLAEIDHVFVTDQAGGLRRIAMARPDAAADKLPVSRIRFGPDIGDALHALEDGLAPTAFSPGILEALRAAYAPGRSYPQGFARFMAALFSAQGLVLVDPSDSRLKLMAHGLFRREIEEASPVSTAVREQSGRMREAGYQPQIELRGDMLTLFHQDPGREAIALQGDGFLLKDSGRSLRAAELLRLLREEPDRFSPNAALRPLYQDSLFPTLAAVLGPSELAYFAQLTTAYERFGIPMPILFPRASVTLLEPKMGRILARLGLSVGDVLVRGETLLDELLKREIPPELSARLEDGRARVEEIWKDLTARITRLDPTLGPTADLASRAGLKQFEFIGKKITQAAKKRDETLRGQVERITAALFPRGGLQERTLTAVPLLARYGTRVLEEECRTLDIFEPVHHCIEIEPVEMEP
jgi:bacillithiol synthase